MEGNGMPKEETGKVRGGLGGPSAVSPEDVGDTVQGGEGCSPEGQEAGEIAPLDEPQDEKDAEECRRRNGSELVRLAAKVAHLEARVVDLEAFRLWGMKLHKALRGWMPGKLPAPPKSTSPMPPE